MSRKKLRVGLIGIGTVGTLHYKTYQSAEKINVVAVCDSSDVRLASLDLRPETMVYHDANTMLADANLDIACILTPPSSHESLTALCAGHGVNVFCEKPIALSAEAAQRMIDVTGKAGVQLFYGSSYRHLPAIQAARRIILAGEIGQVRLMREQSIGGNGLEKMQLMHASHYPVGGPGGFAMGLADHGIHLMDVMGWMMDATVISTTGSGNRSGSAADPEFMLMRFSNGASGHLLYDEGTFATELPGEGALSAGDGWDADGFVAAGTWTRFPSWIHVYGTTGALRIGHYVNELVRIDQNGLTRVTLQGRPSPWHFAAQIDQFADDILNERPASTPASVGMAALRGLLSVYQ
jgi:predicted dehydrogenase